MNRMTEQMIWAQLMTVSTAHTGFIHCIHWQSDGTACLASPLLKPILSLAQLVGSSATKSLEWAILRCFICGPYLGRSTPAHFSHSPHLADEHPLIVLSLRLDWNMKWMCDPIDQWIVFPFSVPSWCSKIWMLWMSWVFAIRSQIAFWWIAHLLFGCFQTFRFLFKASWSKFEFLRLQANRAVCDECSLSKSFASLDLRVSRRSWLNCTKVWEG